MEVDVGPHDVRACRRKLRSTRCVEADHVVREQAVVDRTAQVLGKHVPVVRLGPRNVHEVREQRLGPPRPDEARRQVQVVVVEEDRGVGLAIELRHDRVCERAVDGLVAAVPRGVKAEIDVRRRREPPQVVLDEPERGVRDDVVVPVVCDRVVCDEPKVVRRAVARRLRYRGVRGLGGDRAVLRRHRARDVGDVVGGDEPA